MANLEVSKKWFPTDAPVNAVAPKAETEFSVANAEMVISAKLKGVAHNGWAINLIDPKGNNKALSVLVDMDKKEINISLATGATGAITSKASDIKTKVEAHAIANKLISVAYAAENTGAGVVVAAELVLADGVNGTICQDDDIIVEDSEGQLYVNILPNSIHDANWRKLNLVDY